MARNSNSASSVPITDQIVAVRDRWHTKRYPFFRAFSKGKLPLRVLGRYQAPMADKCLLVADIV